MLIIIFLHLSNDFRRSGKKKVMEVGVGGGGGVKVRS